MEFLVVIATILTILSIILLAVEAEVPVGIGQPAVWSVGRTGGQKLV